MAIRTLYEIASLHPRLKHTRQRTEFEERVMPTITTTTTTTKMCRMNDLHVSASKKYTRGGDVFAREDYIFKERNHGHY